MYHAETIDVAVIGGGHAGCEAALAAARLGMRTVLFAISLDSIAMMPCNPSIGGSSKGHLVREVDALGGEMGKVIDKTYIQTKMLNTGKGPAVYSLRAQADKQAYQSEMKHRLENTPNLKIKQAEIVDIRMENGRVSGVVTAAGAVYDCKAAVLCMGTYMKARCLTGEHITESGPNNLMPATKLSARLREMGIDLFRFKTGTPARMNKNSLDLEKMGPSFEHHPLFPNRVNTEFIRVIDDHTLQMRVWERGSGETFACGTGACAAAVASVLNGYCKREQEILIHLRGGDLRIIYHNDESVTMIGPATFIFEGKMEYPV